MEDKMFELMTKMYSEFTARFESLEKGQQKLVDGQRRLEAIIENDIKPDIRVLFDGYKQTYEKLIVVEGKVDNLAAKVEKQDVEITVIKGGKKTKAK